MRLVIALFNTSSRTHIVLPLNILIARVFFTSSVEIQAKIIFSTFEINVFYSYTALSSV